MGKRCPPGKKRVRVRGHNRCVKRVSTRSTKRPKPSRRPRTSLSMRQCKAQGYTWVKGSKKRRGHCRMTHARAGYYSPPGVATTRYPSPPRYPAPQYPQLMGRLIEIDGPSRVDFGNEGYPRNASNWRPTPY